MIPIPSLLHTFPQTLAGSFSKAGVGLHTGEPVEVQVGPASLAEGRYFVRRDCPQSPPIPACIGALRHTQLSTELARGDVAIRTVEHLLAALVGMGVDGARIEVNGPELPILDGSALEWVRAIAQVGLQPIPKPSSAPQQPITPINRLLSRPEPLGSDFLGLDSLDPDSPSLSDPTVDPPVDFTDFTIAPPDDPIYVRQGDAFVVAFPSKELRFTYGIDFDVPDIGSQWYTWSPRTEDFATAIAPARTFTLLNVVETLQNQGLIKGGSLENALVCGQDGWLNPPLRFSNEPVRHKLLDLVGDLSLLGSIPQAHFLAYKASHSLHTQLVQKLVTHTPT